MTESERAVYKKKYPMHNLTVMDIEGGCTAVCRT